MKVMKKILVVLVFLIFFSACAEQSDVSKEVSEEGFTDIPEAYQSTSLPEKRTFDMAISPVFVLEDIAERYGTVMRELASVTDIYFMQSEIIWDFERGSDIESQDYKKDYLDFLRTAESLGLDTGYVGISVFSVGRDRILRNPFSDTFSDERIRNAYKNMAVRVAKDFKPVYLCLGVEVSAYYHENPADYEHFISLYNETYSRVKAVSPETIVFPTFHYEEFLGVLPWHSHDPDWELIQKFKMDAFAISTYPYMVYSIEEIPKDYYTQIKNHTGLPLIIAESGFATACCGITIKDLHGSEEAQEDFVLFLLENSKEMNTLLWCYWSLYDYEPLSWAGTDKNDVFNSIGLLYADGTPKPAFYIWVQIFKLPRG